MDRLFEVPEKRKKAPAPIRATKGHAKLYQITFGTQQQYIRSEDSEMALDHWSNGHPALTREDATIRVFTQEEIDDLESKNPRLFRSLRRL